MSTCGDRSAKLLLFGPRGRWVHVPCIFACSDSDLSWWPPVEWSTLQNAQNREKSFLSNAVIGTHGPRSELSPDEWPPTPILGASALDALVPPAMPFCVPSSVRVRGQFALCIPTFPLLASGCGLKPYSTWHNQISTSGSPCWQTTSVSHVEKRAKIKNYSQKHRWSPLHLHAKQLYLTSLWYPFCWSFLHCFPSKSLVILCFISS